MAEEVLLIDCPDKKGLIYNITRVLYDHGLNILGNHEFVDAVNSRFFMRTAWEGETDKGSLQNELKSSLPEGSNIRLITLNDRDLVVMATSESHCAGDLLLSYRFGELPARIRALVSNHAILEPLATSFDIPFHLVTHEGLSRTEHEAQLIDILSKYNPDYIVLAKYMRVFTPEFVARYSQRIVNIHHSFLPAFAGAGPYLQAYERGVKIIGATAHIVTDSLDAGPIIAQGVLPVHHGHSASEMVQAGRDVEKMVLARALKLLLEERVFIYNNRTIIFE